MTAYGFNSLTGPHIGRLAALSLPRLQLPVAVLVARQLPALDGQEAAAPGAQAAAAAAASGAAAAAAELPDRGALRQHWTAWPLITASSELGAY